MEVKDLKFFCNKIINSWITYVILTYFIASLIIVGITLFIVSLLVLLLIEEYGLLSYSIYPHMITISICSFIGIFLLSIKFEIQVLLDLKQFVEREAINLIYNNKIDTVTRYLEDICKYLVKSPTDLPELSRLVNNFKNLKYKKEDR